jgi:hypothetical protein
MLPMLDSANVIDRAYKQVSIIFVFVAYCCTSLQNSIFHSPKLTLSCIT